ncbi:uncharacterized protein LOC135823472 [Sycon ciliatum]|uniref:uncharacterized protein LOC135823472 n=1 Tax=Sycon ciliatum TaxID=27933 RepID=UPI0031F6B2A0
MPRRVNPRRRARAAGGDGGGHGAGNEYRCLSIMASVSIFLLFIGSGAIGVGVYEGHSQTIAAGGLILGLGVLLLVTGCIWALVAKQRVDVEASAGSGGPTPADGQTSNRHAGQGSSGPEAFAQPRDPGFTEAAPPMYPSPPAAGAAPVPFQSAPVRPVDQRLFSTSVAPATAAPTYPPAVEIPLRRMASVEPYQGPGAVIDDSFDKSGLPSYDDVMAQLR